ncbi:hypothetical protein FA95DRAFT_1591090 [Auriscalpium vulgare]|uniref:Uncharacterized protein n=1 Tax=Auriscalpium vulgare TaxID=40419 RepID=A0ACB8RB52_9AGAM|nr:hypothetical protein FA95DRAFT_1591090 [Auriscalpium vulgare]
MSDKKTEDALPQSSTYTYKWSPESESELPLADFLSKYKPSMVQDDGTKPWIWVRGSQKASKDDEKVDTAVEEAQALLEEVTEKVESIKNDDSIPMRSSKKTGAKSKKELREAEQAQATEKLKEISIRTGYVSGKWLIFAPADKVDMIWSAVATSLVSGPLSSTAAYLAKVATSPKHDTPNYQHVLCIYMPDVYDKAAVAEVLKTLVGKHGVTTLGVKSNLYTSIGLDSKHASGVPSTVWKNTAVLPDAEIKALKEAYFADLEASKSKPKPAASVPDAVVDDSEQPAEKPAAKGKGKPKLKKKAGKDDPFASDSGEENASPPAPAPKKKAAPKGKKRGKQVDDDEEDDERGGDASVSEDEKKPAKKRRAK